MSLKQNSRKVSTYKNTEDQIFHICQPITVQVHTNQVEDVTKMVFGFTEQSWHSTCILLKYKNVDFSQEKQSNM